jgi:ATP-dependent protease ClpP protease subunit
VTNVYPIKCRIRNEDSGPTRVDVYDDIGEGGWFSEGMSAKSFAAQLSGIKGPLDVHINSCGGEVFDGVAIGNAIRNHKGFKRTVVDGIAASIASVIFQAGDERVVERGAMVMIHDASTMCYGDEAELVKTAGVLGKNSDNIAAIYAERAGGDPQQWRDTMRKETWYTADEAVAAGLADKLGTGDAELPAGMDLVAFSAVPGRIAARLRTMPQAKAPVIVAADGNHAPMTGNHTHSHPAYASQGDDGNHSHSHAHDGDASHSHSHAGTDGGGGDGDGTGDRAPQRPAAVTQRTRVLGIESMPLTDKAIPVHHTATVDEAWDGPAAVAAMPAEYADLHYCHAWQDAGADASSHTAGDDDADDTKGNFKFPHHAREGGPANLAACRNGLARMSSADIPAGDDGGVRAHLQAHLDDGGSSEADDHVHTDVSGPTPEQIRAALRGATQ